MECNCDRWVKNINLIDSSFLLASIHGAHYEIEQFIFCPWCGEKLKETK